MNFHKQWCTIFVFVTEIIAPQLRPKKKHQDVILGYVVLIDRLEHAPNWSYVYWSSNSNQEWLQKTWLAVTHDSEIVSCERDMCNS